MQAAATTSIGLDGASNRVQAATEVEIATEGRGERRSFSRIWSQNAMKCMEADVELCL